MTTRNDKPFDYGKLRPDGQHEKHPTAPEGELIRPVRFAYIHNACGVVTRMSEKIARTYAVNPKFYTQTFCAGCRRYFPVAEFKWDEVNGEVLGS